MRSKWFGDSFDIVKLFFLNILKEKGYKVYCKPFFSGYWEKDEKSAFLNLIGAKLADADADSDSEGKTAILLDPDTGIGPKPKNTHITMQDVFDHTNKYDLVIVFDQAFTRDTKRAEKKIQEKLAQFHQKGLFPFYYDSHARFLFVAKEKPVIEEIEKRILEHGIPAKRLIK